MKITNQRVIASVALLALLNTATASAFAEQNKITDPPESPKAIVSPTVSSSPKASPVSKVTPGAGSSKSCNANLVKQKNQIYHSLNSIRKQISIIDKSYKITDAAYTRRVIKAGGKVENYETQVKNVASARSVLTTKYSAIQAQNKALNCQNAKTEFPKIKASIRSLGKFLKTNETTTVNGGSLTAYQSTVRTFINSVRSAYAAHRPQKTSNASPKPLVVKINNLTVVKKDDVVTFANKVSIVGEEGSAPKDVDANVPTQIKKDEAIIPKNISKDNIITIGEGKELVLGDDALVQPKTDGVIRTVDGHKKKVHAGKTYHAKKGSKIFAALKKFMNKLIESNMPESAPIVLE